MLLATEMSVPKEYADFLDIFCKELAAVLSDYSNINEYAIDLEPGKQPLYGPIYSLDAVKLKTLKTYIETNIANGFI